MKKNNKHAYLIMAHHRFDILEELLKDLDDERNDIFLHIDIKARDFPLHHFNRLLQKATLIFTKRMNIHWGGYSQIKCICNLLKEATSYGYHSYYHFMVGVEFPLKTQDYIHNFFASNNGYEFIGFDQKDVNFEERVKYYHFFNEYARNNTYFQKILNKIRIFVVAVQRLFKIDHSKKYGLLFKKGNANWSITHDLASYIVIHEQETEKIYRYSFCGDEVFVHTLVYNSRFRKKIYDPNDEYHSSMRITTWENKFNRYYTKDINHLLNSGRLFARKIDGNDATSLISLIKKKREDQSTY